MATFLEQFRNGLIAAGVPVRLPSTDDSTKRPLWLEPKLGAPGPGEVDNAIQNDDDLVLSAYRRPGIVTDRHEGDYFRYDNVELRFRTHRPPLVYELEELIRPVLHDRRNYDLGAQRIIESLVYLELANLGSNEQGFTFRIEYAFQRYLTLQP